MYFSRRKDTAPWPPDPAYMLTLALSAKTEREYSDGGGLRWVFGEGMGLAVVLCFLRRDELSAARGLLQVILDALQTKDG